MLLQLLNIPFFQSTDIKIIRWKKRSSAKVIKQTFQLKKVRMFVPQGNVEERTAVPHHGRAL